jgi:NAD(P) transhydrogenase subunit alpha
VKISTIINETERRVAITPDVARKYISLGFNVVLPRNIGVSVGIRDDEYIAVGAEVKGSDFIVDADIYVCVKLQGIINKLYSCKKSDLCLKIHSGSHLIGILNPSQNCKELKVLSKNGVNCYALELLPRIGRAQPMDVLSSQANIAGYRAVLEALSFYDRVVPLMMTAAGTVRPAKVLVLGAGVAGLQAIATAKRIGAVVSAFDVRAIAREQVESLGATFISVEGSDKTSNSYAREMDSDYKKRQREKLLETIAKIDIVISTAQIPGKPAPRLIDKEMIESMPNGSIVVDMATETGGNCELSKKDEVVRIGGVTIVGYSDLASRVAHDSSQFFAKNVLNFVSLMLKDGKIDDSDEIVQATLLKKFFGE